MKKILFAASEAVPFIKTGGLADVVGSLPKYFEKSKYDVRVVLPKYSCMKQEWKEKLEYIDHFYMNINGEDQYVGILKCVLDKITFYFIDNEYYFTGYAPYGDPLWDIEKFAFFSKAVLSILPVIDFRPDLIHCHDWQAGLVPVYLDHFRFDSGVLQRDQNDHDHTQPEISGSLGQADDPADHRPSGLLFYAGQAGGIRKCQPVERRYRICG